TPRVMLPLEIDGSYDLGAEFTRTKADSTIIVVFPVGDRSCQLALSAFSQTVHGLGLIDGKNPDDRSNPATYRQGKLVNDRRYHVLLSVRTKKDEATIDVSLDGKPIITWSGKQSSLAVAPGQQLPYPKRASLGAHRSQVTFHSASLRSTSGKTTLAPHPQPPFDGAAKGRWVDLLADANLDRDTIHGRWFRQEGAVAVAPASAAEDLVRLMLPEVVEGSYDLEAEFTRTVGSSTVAINLPVGNRACTLRFSDRNEGRIQA
ncbi:unnamed protein product, partial [marine sediment metagenome]